MKITFVYPAIGKKPGKKYIKTWKMEPLPIAVLAALTPDDIEIEFFDDRLELIDYGTDTDLVAITVETYTALRAYDIAARFRKRGIKVVMGGYHPTHVPDEVSGHADAVVVGNAEGVWQQVLQDARNGNGLKPRYEGTPQYVSVRPRRDIFAGKDYLNLGLVETGRGCPFKCEFCHITSYYSGRYYPRSIDDVIADVASSGHKNFFFVDDNLVANPGYALDLCKELEGLGINWSAQGTLTMAKNRELLKWMRRSGCSVMLVGFESLEEENLRQMGKEWSSSLGDRDDLVRAIHGEGINMYATFIFGFDHDTPTSFKRAIDFSLSHGFFYTAFNHLLPFPGTPLYERLERHGRLLRPRWWLDREYTYGDVAFQPASMSPEELSQRCVDARKSFFRYSSIFNRGIRLISRRPTPSLVPLYLMSNMNLAEEVSGKYGLPLGKGLDELPK
jgi:radical SAM superfamily enzyme YgiQ (UPF0313 family)